METILKLIDKKKAGAVLLSPSFYSWEIVSLDVSTCCISVELTSFSFVWAQDKFNLNELKEIRKFLLTTH